MRQVRVAIAGAAGRMGQALCALVEEAPDLTLAAAVVLPGQTGGIVLADVDPRQVDVLVDFTHREATTEIGAWVVANRVPWVVGTTGLTPKDQLAIDAAAAQVAVFQASNFSLGVALLTDLAARAARVLGIHADIEIVESHHQHKRDAPSGTALSLAEAVAKARGQRLADVRRDGRSGLTGERPVGEIGLHAVRVSDIVGEHEVIFGWPAERLRLFHDARDRKVFAHGALRAARFVAGLGANGVTGLVGMADLLAAAGEPRPL